MQATFTTAATQTSCIDDGSTEQSFTKHYDIVASIFIRRTNFLRLGNKQYQLERIGKHLRDYEHTPASSIELGVGACWRGVRLYDPKVPAPKASVKKWVDVYQKFRPIVNSDTVRVHECPMDSPWVACVT
jgi:hypothetical protein